MDTTTCEILVRDYKLDRANVAPGARVKDVDVVGVARILGAQITAAYLKPREAGDAAFDDQAPPRHGYLARFTATVSVDSRAGEYVKVQDVTVTEVEPGTVVESN